jgi:hypothetical protein
MRQNHKIPRWKPRSIVGVYLGFSPDHASSVPLVLSTTTGLVSPQYHVVFDDNFTTTTSFKNNQLPTNWNDLFNSTATVYVDEDFSSTTLYDSSFFDTPSFQRESIQPSSSQSSQPQREASSQSVTFSSEPPTIIEPIATPSNITNNNTQPHIGWNPTHRYNTRFRLQHTANLSIQSDAHTYKDPLLDTFLQSHNIHPISNPTCYQSISPQSISSPDIKDTLHYGEMLQDSDRKFFEKDMCREVQDLISTGTVTIVPRSSVASWINRFKLYGVFIKKELLIGVF